MTKNRNKCLGKGKGRIYPPMRDESKKFLNEYYRLYNEDLFKLLDRLGYEIPNWLDDELKEMGTQNSANEESQVATLVKSDDQDSKILKRQKIQTE